ncbi:hypothetical protein DACRYDRAFT_19150 [Dacryopinax primogenitus]|uniref:BRCT domain-containing protein n=1 Tax=Dacryopinax primogenitus (strain DJM 731) TaxID=1858805 RepID=M5FU14_DACPD|nr:uncharacterized protein DACRYDRAFT_19150 [Dacryopinax primogenitus]EJT96686.1 hypothetical protein DACRYDRAFT_19150 [Dacryopinax primogenitus]
MAPQSYPFIRTRSMTQRMESAFRKSPPKASSNQGLVPPAQSTRIPLSEALLNLECDGSPKKSTSIPTTSRGTFEIAPLKFDTLLARPAPDGDKENPFLVRTADQSSPSPTKKRKAPGDDEELMFEDSPKRAKVAASVDEQTMLVAEEDKDIEDDDGLGQVQRKIEFLSLKRARDSMSPSPVAQRTESSNLAPPDPDIDDASPRKRQRSIFLSGAHPAFAPKNKQELPEMPHINLARPPPSPTRPRQLPSPTKFTGVPQLWKNPISRSQGSGSLFAMSIGDKLPKKGDEDVKEIPDQTFMGNTSAARTKVTPVPLQKSGSPSTASVTSVASSARPRDLAPPPSVGSSDIPAPLASPPRPCTPPVLAPRPEPVAATSPLPTPLKALSPPGRLPTSRLPVRSTRIRGQAPITSLAQEAQQSPLQPQNHSMPTRSGSSRPVRVVRQQMPPSAFRAPPQKAAVIPEQDILAPIKDADHVSRDVGTVGPSGRVSLSSLSNEAQTSLSNLSTALGKLNLPPPRSSSRIGFTPKTAKENTKITVQPGPSTFVSAKKGHARNSSRSKNASSLTRSQTTSALTTLTNPFPSLNGGPSETVHTTERTGPETGHTAPLTGCVVFVEVRTKDGDDAGGVFVEMLKILGARVLKYPSPSVTHLVLKSPLPHTITRYHNLPDPKPETVAVGWVVKCAEENRRVEVTEWRLDLSAGAGIMSAIPGCSTRPNARSAPGRGLGRRISMEPSRVELLNEANLSQIVVPLGLEDQVERAKRKSLLYQPKFSSPLRTNAFVPGKPDDDNAEMEDPEPVL